MQKTTQNAASLLQEESDLARKLLEALKARVGMSHAEDTRVARSPFKRDDTPSKPIPPVPAREVKGSDLLSLIEDTLAKAEANQQGPIVAGLGLVQEKDSPANVFGNLPKMPAGAEWTISKEAPKPSDQRDQSGKQLKGDSRIAFYAHPPGEKAMDVPISVGQIKQYKLEPPAAKSASDRSGK